jgi:hypothetical protein
MTHDTNERKSTSLPQIALNARPVWVLNTAASPEFLKTFLATQAFEDDPDILIDALQDHPGSLIPFADLVCDTVDKSVEIIRDPNRKPDRRIPMIDRHLSTVLLRQRLRGRLVSLHEVHR